MTITECIKELLHTHGEVIVPGFGIFRGILRPARTDPATGMLLPPGRQVVFELLPGGDDDLLVNYLSEREQITLPQAGEKIASFVATVMQGLNKSRKVRLVDFGLFSLDRNGKLAFKLESTSPFYEASFGLEPIRPAIARAFGSKKGLRRMTAAPPHRVVPVTAWYLLVFLVVISIAGYFGYLYKEFLFNKYSLVFEKVQHLRKVSATHNPFAAKPGVRQERYFYRHYEGDVHKLGFYFPGSRAADNPTDSMHDAPPPFRQGYDPARGPGTVLNDTVQDTLTEVTVKQYYIVAGSFALEETAQKLVVKLKEKGYQAKIFGKNPKGHYMVCYEMFATRGEALEALGKYRPEDKNVWVLGY